MRQGIPNTIWVTGGCTSWYMDKSGLPNLYPFPPQNYLQSMHEPKFQEYRLEKDLGEPAAANAA